MIKYAVIIDLKGDGLMMMFFPDNAPTEPKRRRMEAIVSDIVGAAAINIFNGQPEQARLGLRLDSNGTVRVERLDGDAV